MAPTTLHHDIPVRPVLTLRRAVALTAIAAFGLLAPAAAGAAPGETPPAPEGPGDLSAEQPCAPDGCEPDPDECAPPLGSCDIAIPEPDDCPPPAATCDFTAGEPDPDDPGEPGEPGEVDPSTDPVTPTGVDAPVLATPNFTG